MVTVDEILRLLRKEYGLRRWQLDRDPVSTLIATVLSQNTSDANSKRAFNALIDRFGNWESVAAVTAKEIAECIRAGGLAEVKAKRIKLILERIQEQRGRLDISFLEKLPLPEARSWLRQLPRCRAENSQLRAPLFSGEASLACGYPCLPGGQKIGAN